MSLPAWERGLKSQPTGCHYPNRRVAPCVGAWIEIDKWPCWLWRSTVAPCVGAWIEIKSLYLYVFTIDSRSLRGSVD